MKSNFGEVDPFVENKKSQRVCEVTLQLIHCAHLDSSRYGNSRGVHHYRCQACRRIFQTLRRGKDPTYSRFLRRVGKQLWPVVAVAQF